MGTRVYQIGGGNPSTSGNQNFWPQLLASLIGNDSSVSGATVKAALDALSGGDAALAALVAANTANISANTTSIANNSSAIVGIGSYPYIAPPAVANAFDDEFSSGSNDWAVRGYTIVNASTGTVQTRSGNINPWDATGPAANTYWSTLIGSWLFTQAPAGIQLDIYKTISLAAGDSYFCRMVGSYCLATNSNGRFNEVGLYAASGAMLDGNNRVYTTIRDDTTTSYLISDTARLTAGVLGSGAAGRLALGGHDIRGIRFDSGTTHYASVIDSQNGEVKAVNITGAPSAASLTRFGIRNLFSTAGGIVPQIWGVDFIRKKTSNAWLIP